MRNSEIESELDDPWAIATFGSTIESYRPTRTFFIVCFSIGSIFLVLGSGLAFAAPKLVHNGDSTWPLIIAGLSFALMGLGVILDVGLRLTLHVYLCERGFYYDWLWKRRIFLWNSIRCVRENVVYWYKSDVDVRGGFWSSIDLTFRIENNQGQTFSFGNTQGMRAEQLELTLRDAAIAFGFPWEVREHHTREGS